MSEVQTVEVEYKDEGILIESLKELGYQPKVHQNGIDMDTYYNKGKKPKAHILIKKSQFGGYMDCGFERIKDGFQMHIDNMDHRKFKSQKLKQIYPEKKIMKYIKGRSKFSVKSRKVDKEGNVRIRLSNNF